MSNFKFKILLMKSENVDIEKFVKNQCKKRFQTNDIIDTGVDILTKDVEFQPGKIANFSIWHVKTDQRFEFIKSTFYTGSAGAIFFFDLMSPESLKTIIGLIEDAMNHIPDLPFILIGLKNENVNEFDISLDRTNIKEFVENLGGFYLETSLDNENNVEKALRELAHHIISSRISI